MYMRIYVCVQVINRLQPFLEQCTSFMQLHYFILATIYITQSINTKAYYFYFINV